MTNLPNNLDKFTRVGDKMDQENIHKDLHNQVAETLEAVQKHSGAHHVDALPTTSEVGHVYTLLVVDGQYQPGIYVCVAPDPVYLPLASRGEGFVKEFDFTDTKNINIEHNLSTKGIFVKLFDTEYNEIEYDEYKIVDEDNILIQLTEATSGKAILLAGGKDGMPPSHEWNGTELRFKNPNGSWGPWVDLIAEIENKGIQGETGPMPEHQWDGTKIRFKLNNDTWGAWVDLKGLPGSPGVGIPGEPGADGQDGKGIVWRGTYSSSASYVINDQVFYNGSSYICIAPATAKAPSDKNYWEISSSRGADGGEAGATIELEAAEDIAGQGFLETSFSGTGFENLKVGENIEKTKSYSKTLLGIKLAMQKEGTPIGPITLKVYSKVDGVRNATEDISLSFNASDIGGSFEYKTFLFDSAYEAEGEKDIVLSSEAGDADNYINVDVENYIEILNQSTPVYIGSDGRVYVSQDLGIRNKVDGFVSQPALANTLVLVTVAGIEHNFNALVSGDEYFLSDELGQITNEIRDIKVGKALNSSSLLIQEEEVKVNRSTGLRKDEDGLGIDVIDPDNIQPQTSGYLTGGAGHSDLSVFQALANGDNDGAFKINIDGVEYDNIAVELTISEKINTASYDALSFPVSSQEKNPYGLFFNPDGTRMYVIGNNKAVYQYTLSTPWEINTASYDNLSFSVGSQDSVSQSLFFNPSGTKMYIVGNNSDTVHQYTLSTPWQIDTASYDNLSFSVSGQNPSPYSLFFNSTGSKMYVLGSHSVYQYTLSTPWEINTASYDALSFSVYSQTLSPRSLFFNSTGSKMYVLGHTDRTVHQYTLSTPWEINTASYDALSFYVGSQEYYPYSLFFNPTCSKMYVLGSGKIVYQYSLEAMNSLDEVATKMQSEIRQKTNSLETVEYDTDHFKITSSTLGRGSKILKLMPPSSGTDISGEGYLDLGANATEVAGAGEEYNLVRLDKDGQVPIKVLNNASPVYSYENGSRSSSSSGSPISISKTIPTGTKMIIVSWSMKWGSSSTSDCSTPLIPGVFTSFTANTGDNAIDVIAEISGSNVICRTTRGGGNTAMILRAHFVFIK